ncbi:SDR family NAD(P)-dependent oxidoreductase [Rhodococcoides kyotonense]|uniref:3-oxoacyl-[acyl-carrier protein] reductase n=1 Tax=Rhodococcoides kyotonense TaxID=398843 RepID=A0A239M1V1_9NOCA|nr:SDR family oxidoreductase [Rhodococcus kyotonensis]SNT36747.1 3-oxoacyl-[acyl-carrier protein] reductase [Rhodococcus kyotonensis]
MFESNGKVALITGAGRGVGAAVAEMLAAHGALVAVNDLNPDRAASMVERIESEGGRAVAVPGDIAAYTSVEEIFHRIASTLGPVDFLVNNAGIPTAGIELSYFADTRPSDWQPLLQVNVAGVLNCCHLAVPAMIERKWGRIISISSDSARTGESMMAVYAASKAAGVGLIRSLSKELGPHGITCNTLSLGTIASEDTRSSDPEKVDRHLRRYPMRRLGTGDDVAAAVLWLASESGGWTTGQTIPVNGGFAAG